MLSKVYDVCAVLWQLSFQVPSRSLCHRHTVAMFPLFEMLGWDLAQGYPGLKPYLQVHLSSLLSGPTGIGIATPYRTYPLTQNTFYDNNFVRRNCSYYFEAFATLISPGKKDIFQGITHEIRQFCKNYSFQGTKIQPEVFLTEVFFEPPLGSWTSAPSGHERLRRNAYFSKISRA